MINIFRKDKQQKHSPIHKNSYLVQNPYTPLFEAMECEFVQAFQIFC